MLELASHEDPEDDQYQVVLFQHGDQATYQDFLATNQDDLRASYGVISPKKIDIQVEGASVEAVRCDIQAYYAVLATITYDSGDVIYVSAPDPAGLPQRRAEPDRKREPRMKQMREGKAMQRLAGLMRKAVQDYEMLAPGGPGADRRVRRQGQRGPDGGPGPAAGVHRFLTTSSRRSPWTPSSAGRRGTTPLWPI